MEDTVAVVGRIARWRRGVLILLVALCVPGVAVASDLADAAQRRDLVLLPLGLGLLVSTVVTIAVTGLLMAWLGRGAEQADG